MKKEELVSKLEEFKTLVETFNHDNYTRAVYVLKDLKGVLKPDTRKKLEEAWRNDYVNDNNKEVNDICNRIYLELQ